MHTLDAPTTLDVSASDSPFTLDEELASAVDITLPPSRCMEDSKDNLVLVLGSWNIVARIFPEAIL